MAVLRIVAPGPVSRKLLDARHRRHVGRHRVRIDHRDGLEEAIVQVILASARDAIRDRRGRSGDHLLVGGDSDRAGGADKLRLAGEAGDPGGIAVGAGKHTVIAIAEQINIAARSLNVVALAVGHAMDRDIDATLRDRKNDVLVVELDDVELGAAGQPDAGLAKPDLSLAVGIGPECGGLRDRLVQLGRCPLVVGAGMEADRALQHRDASDPCRRIGIVGASRRHDRQSGREGERQECHGVRRAAMFRKHAGRLHAISRLRALGTGN